MPDFKVTCNEAAQRLALAQGAGTCTGMDSAVWAAMNKIVCGRDNTEQLRVYSYSDAMPRCNGVLFRRNVRIFFHE